MAGGSATPTPDDRIAVAHLLGREPEGEFTVVVRSETGTPQVIMNHPLLRDGTPMPTRYWLVDPVVRHAVSRLEADGGVARATEMVDPDAVEDAHQRYAALRDVELAADHAGPRPSGGVGGTRKGVKCLHAHIAWWLAGGDDPVGEWTAEELGIKRTN